MSSNIIVAEVPGFLQVLSDGSVKRFPLPTVAASSSAPDNSSDGYKFKDVVIDAAKSVTARIFLPDSTPDRPLPQQLPVLVYFHGGGFCIGTTAWSGLHGFLRSLCVRSQVLIVSVDYRLAPEHKLPAAFDDGYLSLQWLALARARSDEPWLDRADLSRVFLSGESAGANIVHNVMLRVVEQQQQLAGVEIKGLMIIHPFFGSEGRVGSEMGSEEAEKWVRMGDLLWQLSLPEGADRDHPACNFANYCYFVDHQKQQFPAVMVFVAGLDTLKDRGIMYAEFLKAKGLTQDVELVIAQEQNHAFHVYINSTPTDSQSEATSLLLAQMADFINQH